jgi:hypothetical protein
MKRINIEASGNLSHLLRLRHRAEDAFLVRLRRAYEWLPMPQRRVRRNWEPVRSLQQPLLPSQTACRHARVYP